MACSKAAVVDLSPEARPKRSCACCLNSLPTGKVPKCQKCRRRAYCDRGCQVADWKPCKNGSVASSAKATGVGQGHKNWRSFNCGEEGLDWAIQEIQGKGRGLVALRDLPAQYRILVEGAQKLDQSGLENHPGFECLYEPPVERIATISVHQTPKERKYYANSILRTVLGFRTAMANHSCNPNAGILLETEMGVQILYSLRPIAKDEEICTQYLSFNNVTKPIRPLQVFAERLLSIGIVCPDNCVCKDPLVHAKLQELVNLLGTPIDPEDTFKLSRLESDNPAQNEGCYFALNDMAEARRAVELGEEVHLDMEQLIGLYYAAFQIACTGLLRKELELSATYPYIQKVQEFLKKVHHPDC